MVQLLQDDVFLKVEPLNRPYGTKKRGNTIPTNELVGYCQYIPMGRFFLLWFSKSYPILEFCEALLEKRGGTASGDFFLMGEELIHLSR